MIDIPRSYSKIQKSNSAEVVSHSKLKPLHWINYSQSTSLKSFSWNCFAWQEDCCRWQVIRIPRTNHGKLDFHFQHWLIEIFLATTIKGFLIIIIIISKSFVLLRSIKPFFACINSNIFHLRCFFEVKAPLIW